MPRFAEIAPTRAAFVTFCAALVVMVAFWASRAASAQQVDLELILAVDSSASVDTLEFRLQTSGMATALRDPKVHQAITTGPYKSISILVMEWAGADFQAVTVPWTLIDGPEAAVAIANRIERLQRAISTGATSISGAMDFASRQFDHTPYKGLRRVLDVSCDGRNNQGANVWLTRDRLIARGITINGLVILNEHPNLDRYFDQEVIGGDGAFVEAAVDYADYSDAFLRKLLREVQNVPIGQAPPPDGDDTRLASADDTL